MGVLFQIKLKEIDSLEQIDRKQADVNLMKRKLSPIFHVLKRAQCLCFKKDTVILLNCAE